MSRPTYTVDLSPRQNVSLSTSHRTYIWNYVGLAVLALLGYVIAVFVLT